MTCPADGKRIFPGRVAADEVAARLGHEVYECRNGHGWHTGRSHRHRAMGLRWADTATMRVTASMRHGAVLPVDFPACLDGILAAAARRRQLGGRYGMVRDRSTVRLPLANSSRLDPTGWQPDCGSRWVWAASCATWDGQATDVRHWHSRFDDLAAEQVVDRLPASTDTGRLKPWRSPLQVTVAAELVWWAVGDPDAVRDLLGEVQQVGHKRSQGEGLVMAWSVLETGPPSWQRVAWQHERIGRPFPARAAGSLGVPDADTVPGAYRPPYFWAPATPVPNAGWRMAWHPVLAPWTCRAAPQ